MMVHLIKKDFLIQRRNLLLSVMIAIGLSLVWSNMGSSSFMMSTVVVSYLLIYGASAIEDKYNSDIMLVSFPISKIKIVLAKYVSVYAFACFAIIVNLLIYTLQKVMAQVLNLPYEMPAVSWQSIAAAIGILTIFMVISLPLIFRYGYMKARLINLIVLFAILFVMANLIESLEEHINDISQYMPVLIGSVMIVLLAISIRLSILFYRRREY